ncbi:anthranilate phosphoribosyltransferase [Halomarina litorea]|uniref:anthranilate phosphoribosyltransferase n=1 Tax=Halomarina litorea TaxID=2961595 RepID=UPI0020C30D08|nr:anthranilate phosphoribosyltransferase [Halomarina sp. BCD28]
MKDHIARVTDGGNLTQEEARAAATAVFEDATEAQIGALLAALRAKGETEAEIAGFAQGMRDAALTISPDRSPLVDTCGTGGDDHDTINVSTTSALVVSAAGVPVAKHGNYSVSSSSGSSDVLAAVGVDLDSTPEAVEARIEADGIGYMHAPAFHPAMKAVIGPRKELGVPTLFNILGPLTNPAGANGQVVGVYSADLVPVIARALAKMDVDRALVVHSEGLDEVGLHSETTVAEVRGTEVEEYTITPEDLGLSPAPIEAVVGGTPEENAADLRGIVTGEVTGPKCDIILANAGAAVYVAGEADTLADGVEQAREAIESGRAEEKLDDLRAGVSVSA